MSETNQKATLTIYYLNGHQESFEFHPNPNISQANAMSRIHKILDSRQLILELSDRVLIIPMSSIQKVEMSPIPEKLPDQTIRGVQRIN